MNAFTINISFNELIVALSIALDAYGTKSRIHGERTAVIAERIASEFYFEDQANMFYTGLLNDIGANEYDPNAYFFHEDEIKGLDEEALLHPVYGERVFQIIEPLNKMAPIVRSHHEFHNGKGFPDGLAGDDIPELSQVLLLADFFDIIVRKNPEIDIQEIPPLFEKERGVLFHPESLDEFLEVFHDDMDFFDGLRYEKNVKQEVSQLLEKYADESMEGKLHEVLEIFAQIIDSKHQYTKGHSDRVSKLALALSDEMGLSHLYGEMVEVAGILHDLGKLAVPTSILDKPGKLTTEEFNVVRRHPGISQSILESFESLYFLAEIVGCHHEWYNGEGYPNGYKGEEIPIISRILSVADIFDALTSDRAYRKALTYEKTFSIMKDVTGVQLDPEIVKVALKVFPKVSF